MTSKQGILVATSELHHVGTAIHHAGAVRNLTSGKQPKLALATLQLLGSEGHLLRRRKND
jgi:hypothetical protein